MKLASFSALDNFPRNKMKAATIFPIIPPIRSIANNKVMINSDIVATCSFVPL